MWRKGSVCQREKKGSKQLRKVGEREGNGERRKEGSEGHGEMRGGRRGRETRQEEGKEKS